VYSAKTTSDLALQFLPASIHGARLAIMSRTPIKIVKFRGAMTAIGLTAGGAAWRNGSIDSLAERWYRKNYSRRLRE
jgi:hypothetical protein